MIYFIRQYQGIGLFTVQTGIAVHVAEEKADVASQGISVSSRIPVQPYKPLPATLNGLCSAKSTARQRIATQVSRPGAHAKAENGSQCIVAERHL